MQDRFEFLILGGGLAGLAVAAALAPHRRLCLVEREAWLCRHASGRAAAMFIPTYGGPVVSRLARASRGLLAPDLLEPRAALHLASEETDLAAVQQWGRGRRIDAAEIAKLAPGLRAGTTTLGFLETDAGLIDLAGLVDRLRRAVLRHGPIVTGFESETIERRQGCWRLRSAERTLAGAVLVNAAGPWADEMARLAGVQPQGLDPGETRPRLPWKCGPGRSSNRRTDRAICVLPGTPSGRAPARRRRPRPATPSPIPSPSLWPAKA